MKRYPWYLALQLGAHIERHAEAKARQCLERVLMLIGQRRGGGLILRKLRCAQHASYCLRGALRAGVPGELLLTEHLGMLELLGRARGWSATQHCMRRYVDQLLERVRPQRRTNLERLVVWMRKDMRATVSAPKALDAYARDGKVSVAHLSRTFAAIVGVTFREDLLRLRMEEACRLLAKTDLKIGAVARLVGLRDPSQFVAQFRREIGQTPGAYRLLKRASRKQPSN